MLIGGIIGIIILVPAAITIIVTNYVNVWGAGVFLLLIADIVNVISYIVMHNKYRKYSSEQTAVIAKSTKLDSPATITVSRGANDGLQSSLKLQICNNGRFEGYILIGNSISFKSEISTNSVTTAYIHPVTGAEIPLKTKLTLELSNDEEAHLHFEGSVETFV